MITRNQVVFDLDGVLRDLLGCLNKRFGVPIPTTYHWRHKGKTIFDYFGEYPNLLKLAPKTKYLDTIKRYNISPFIIWSAQPKGIWQTNAVEWIKSYNISNYSIEFLSTKEKYQKLHKNNDIFLVEDNPTFSNYDRIWLIDAPYNKKINVPYRIKTPKQLELLLESVGYGGI
jgi:hypothetical protein